MVRSTDYRRFGLDFTGTRPVLRLGDPGVDNAWLRRYRSGSIGATAWLVLLPLLLGVGFLSTWGPFGRIDSWQIDTFGSGNVVLLVILFMPLTLAPLIAAHLLPIDASTPVLLGIRQSFDSRWGPRVLGRSVDPRLRFQTVKRGAKGAAMLGAAVTAFFAFKGFHDADAPHAPLPETSYARLADPHAPLPYAVRLADAVADRSTEWVHRYSVRQDMHHDYYFALRPARRPPAGPVAIVELDQTSPQYETAAWNMVDAPGPREGLPEPLDDWTAGELRRAGITLAAHVIVLKRQQLGGHDPRPDPLDDLIYGTFGFVALFCGMMFWWSFARAERKLPQRAEASISG